MCYKPVKAPFTLVYYGELLNSDVVSRPDKVDKAGRHEAMAAPTCARALAQEASWARTTPPLFDFSVYRLAIGREGINPWAEQ